MVLCRCAVPLTHVQQSAIDWRTSPKDPPPNTPKISPSRVRISSWPRFMHSEIDGKTEERLNTTLGIETAVMVCALHEVQC